MSNVSVSKVTDDDIQFSDGTTLTSDHEQDCCEYHYLDFSNLSVGDFNGLLFDLSGDTFFERIDGYGIALKPITGHPVRIPGYGNNNGYYSTELRLVLQKDEIVKEFDISECQDIVS